MENQLDEERGVYPIPEYDIQIGLQYNLTLGFYLGVISVYVIVFLIKKNYFYQSMGMMILFTLLSTFFFILYFLRSKEVSRKKDIRRRNDKLIVTALRLKIPKYLCTGKLTKSSSYSSHEHFEFELSEVNEFRVKSETEDLHDILYLSLRNENEYSFLWPFTKGVQKEIFDKFLLYRNEDEATFLKKSETKRTTRTKKTTMLISLFLMSMIGIFLFHYYYPPLHFSSYYFSLSIYAYSSLILFKYLFPRIFIDSSHVVGLEAQRYPFFIEATYFMSILFILLLTNLIFSRGMVIERSTIEKKNKAYSRGTGLFRIFGHTNIEFNLNQPKDSFYLYKWKESSSVRIYHYDFSKVKESETQVQVNIVVGSLGLPVIRKYKVLKSNDKSYDTSIYPGY